MTLDETIEIFTSNAEHERTHGNLQGCLEFRQLAEWLKDYKRLLEQDPCEDAISRQALLDAFGFSEKTRKWGGDHSGYDTMMLYEIQDMIESVQSINPQEPKLQTESEDVIRREDALMALTGEWTEPTDELIHKFIKRIKNFTILMLFYQ